MARYSVTTTTGLTLFLAIACVCHQSTQACSDDVNEKLQQRVDALEATVAKLVEQRQAREEYHLDDQIKSDGGMPKNYVQRCESQEITLYATNQMTTFASPFRTTPSVLLAPSGGSASMPVKLSHATATHFATSYVGSPFVIQTINYIACA